MIDRGFRAAKRVARAVGDRLPGSLTVYTKRFGCRSYAQEGEDMILGRVFERQPAGFYVDVGAHHPKRFSNTHYFYKRGWRGINIDAVPGSMRLFRALRPRDVNVEAAVGTPGRELELFVFNDPALNSVDRALAQSRVGPRYHIVGTKRVVGEGLAQLLARHLPPGQGIDFMSVDVEGLDLEVLRSNDWSRFRPRYLLAEEAGGHDLEELSNGELCSFLRSQSYALFAKTVNTLIFRDKRSKES